MTPPDNRDGVRTWTLCGSGRADQEFGHPVVVDGPAIEIGRLTDTLEAEPVLDLLEGLVCGKTGLLLAATDAACDLLADHGRAIEAAS